jgi:hypothetical protein
VRSSGAFLSRRAPGDDPRTSIDRRREHQPGILGAVATTLAAYFGAIDNRKYQDAYSSVEHAGRPVTYLGAGRTAC